MAKCFLERRVEIAPRQRYSVKLSCSLFLHLLVELGHLIRAHSALLEKFRNSFLPATAIHAEILSSHLCCSTPDGNLLAAALYQSETLTESVDDLLPTLEEFCLSRTIKNRQVWNHHPMCVFFFQKVIAFIAFTLSNITVNLNAQSTLTWPERIAKALEVSIVSSPKSLRPWIALRRSVLAKRRVIVVIILIIR